MLRDNFLLQKAKSQRGKNKCSLKGLEIHRKVSVVVSRWEKGKYVYGGGGKGNKEAIEETEEISSTREKQILQARAASFDFYPLTHRGK